MKTTRIFLKTKFTGFHQNTTLISIGLISECDKTFYAEFTDYDKNQIDNWLQKNIIDNLLLPHDLGGNGVGVDGFVGDTKFIKEELEKWLSQFENIEIWGDYISYDWVLFNQIFENESNFPKNIYYIPFDLCTLFKIKGLDPSLNREKFVNIDSDIIKKHNALFEAKIIKECYFKLNF